MKVSKTSQKDGVFNYTKWERVKVGDIVEIDLNDVIPADILLLESSDPNKLCFVETSNLDGETNLKQKSIIDVPFDSIDTFEYKIETQPPNSNLNDFQESGIVFLGIKLSQKFLIFVFNYDHKISTPLD